MVLDDRLELSLFASDPDIVTPIGIAVDDRDRVYVLESHTHLPPSGYDGPKGDRIKVFVDRDADGSPESVSVFAEDLQDGMNLAFSPEGELYVVTSRAVWVLHDRDGNGISESRTKVIDMVDPEQVYDHAALLGITFSADGWLYVSRGNTGGQAWRLEGTDGSSVSGYGDGGNVVRSRPDGTDLQEFATGFWNPFDLKFDASGRLLAADNDPDSRGPNRLIHVVKGGDYGYKSLYGGSGIHPYLAWHGELPGTLPYVAGLGEAPSGLLDATLSALPQDYRGDLLCTIWEESKIVRIRLAPKGASVIGEVAPLVEGGPEFRPVALAADGSGTIYITDWVVREYPNHGRGRIWRLAAAPGVERMHPRPAFASPVPDAGSQALQALYGAESLADFERLRRALTSEDPFIRTAAITALADSTLRPEVVRSTQDPDARVRLGALLALHRARHQPAEPIARRLLADPDPHVRRMALIWAGSTGMVALRQELDQAISAEDVSPELFEVYLATVRHLAPEFIEAYEGRAEPYAENLERPLPPRFLETFLTDPTKPEKLRAVALAHLDPAEAEPDLLVALARDHTAPLLRQEAIRSLAFTQSDEGAAVLVDIVQDRSNPPPIRAEALVALAHQPVDVSARAVEWLDDPEQDVRLEAGRYLRSRVISAQAREAMAQKYASLRPASDADALREQLAFALAANVGEAAGRPSSLEAWQTVLSHGGDPEVGRRVFFSPLATCSRCHTVNKRGGTVGPDLTNIGRSKTRRQLVHSILRPSDEVTPEWQGWYVKTKDGGTHYGRQIDVGSNGTAELYVLPGEFVSFENVEAYGPVDQSLMPEGLESRLTVGELRDLVAFLDQR